MARSKLGDSAGTRALVEVLLLHRHLAAGDVEAGLTAALRLQSPSVDVVAVEARKADGHPDPGPVPFSLALKRVAPIRDGRHGQPEHSVVVLPSDPRPLPTVHQYDQLLIQLTSTKAQAR
jgi:hypothetical protein